MRAHGWHLSTCTNLYYFVLDPSLICALCEESSLWLEDCMDEQPRELIPQLSLGLDQSRALLPTLQPPRH